jgi:hypothetical protein
MIKTFILDKGGKPLNASFHNKEEQEYFQSIILWKKYTLHIEVFLGGVPVRMTQFKKCVFGHIPLKPTAYDIRYIKIMIDHNSGDIPFSFAAPTGACLDTYLEIDTTSFRPFSEGFTFFYQDASSYNAADEVEKHITIDGSNIIIKLIFSLTEKNSIIINQWLKGVDNWMNLR